MVGTAPPDLNLESGVASSSEINLTFISRLLLRTHEPPATVTDGSITLVVLVSCVFSATQGSSVH